MNEAINSAATAAGGQSALARLLGIKPPTVNQWVKGTRAVPARFCPDIEAATGVPCEELRPDVNWAVLRGGRGVGHD
ncbi:Cro/Cl family transcriptional regulator [Vandammella animalimorsus]|uniref:Cro/Cl family transcriptional regulator n=1 Tax=Vandammella animalimorsus TaxID=2029117 RepID=A0A2A2T4S5_9BURK|nr:helix-turn-helix domain-containing protein [Vandammella animalimorsus]PAT31860.1 Cro/Cl family transcriptional regulator [Vandammella animalimorsus]PAX16493.1 Cro/Cl family transcriptional regulator [Vandammella animalimorsus]PAX18908.1 Cro/Cl family transcriptional regulator [Vandammella animalimorsus]